MVHPAKQPMYRDFLFCDPAINPVNVGAVWFPKPINHLNQHQRGRRVFLHLHGGAYLLGSGRDIDMSFGDSQLLRYSSGSAVFCPEYRLSSLPGGRFPAALQDAVTAYAYLVTQLQIPAGDIILSSDSAGAHLALALLQYINAHQDALPKPAAVFLWSPWPDMTIGVEAADHRPATKVDHVAPELIAWTYREFLPGEDAKVSRNNSYLSPGIVIIPTRVPIWVQWGSAEVLKEDIEKFVQIQGSGNDGEVGGCLHTYEVPNAPHDIFALAPLLGWKAEASKAVVEAIRFLDSRGL